MAQIYQFRDLRPVISPDAYLDDNAVIIGDVVIEAGCYIGPFAVLRGDFSRITIGTGSNVQDNCLLHSLPDSFTYLEPDTHIGHGAVLHGCHIGRNAMVGMNAVVMDHVSVGENAIIGAMAFVRTGMEIPPNMLAFGNPVKIIRELSEADLANKIIGTDCYKKLTKEGLNGNIRKCEPLSQIEPNRPTLEWDIMWVK